MKQWVVIYICTVTKRHSIEDTIARGSLPHPLRDTSSLQAEETQGFHPEDGDDKFLLHVGSYKNHMASYPKRQHSSVHQLFIDFKKAYDSVRKEVLKNNLTEDGVNMKLFMLIKMCLNETYDKTHTDKYMIVFLSKMV
jgi:hypothetical protein